MKFLRTFLFVMCLLLLISAAGCVSPVVVAPENRDAEIDTILAAAESLFQAMEQCDYEGIWNHLTEKSKQQIISDVYKACRKRGDTVTPESLDRDFEAGGPAAKSYWDAFLFHFDPDTVLSRSTWSMGDVSARKAEIQILYEKSEHPAVVKMFKENGAWKVGLEETFRLRRYLPTW
ncbi:MAG: hypothetical protein AVO39_11615 [delta proteobacterium MLS_D]|jgi:hypothetical protein|nr:MAG: hypothetical protein AVO39_11615 [delta proteobacterium MLS_D]